MEHPPYVILSTHLGKSELEERVRKYVKAGYTPIGGVSVAPASLGFIWSQAIWKPPADSSNPDETPNPI